MILKTELFSYQREAVEKLLPIRVGALYFDMGTGKTRTALEIIQRRIEAGKIKKVLWMCPCSVKGNLAADLDKHADGWRKHIYIAGLESLSSSDKLYIRLLKFVDSSSMVIVDESNLIKNNFAKRTRRMYEIGKLSRYRMILNGTPVTRNEADLYAQWYFLDHRIFGYRTFWSFAANHLEYDSHHKVRRVLNTDYLAEKIAPYSVVRKKEDVLNLPDKEYSCYCFPLDSDQMEHYCEVGENLIDQLDEDNDASIYRMLTALQLVSSGRYVKDSDTDHFTTAPFFRDSKENPRIRALMNVLQDTSGKRIIWVKFQHEADEIASCLPKGSYQIFTGAVRPKAREEALKAFREDPECLYLIANKVCGGYGLNLQFCHTAIYYDNDFNYGTRVQSEDRIYRLGQDQECQIIDIWGICTIDDMIDRCLAKKESLVDAMKEEIKSREDWKERILDNDPHRLFTRAETRAYNKAHAGK